MSIHLSHSGLQPFSVLYLRFMYDIFFFFLSLYFTYEYTIEFNNECKRSTSMTSIKRHANTLVAGSRNGLRTGGCSTSCSAAKVQGGEVKKVQEGESRALPADPPDSERLFLSELRAASLVSALDSLALRFQRLSSGNSMQTVQRGRLQMLERPSGTNWQVFFFFPYPPGSVSSSSANT